MTRFRTSPNRVSGRHRVLSTLCLALLFGSIGCTDVPQRTGDPKVDLRSSDPQIRGEAAIDAGKMRDASAIPQLLDLLEDREYAVRLNAHFALILISGRSDFGYYALDTPSKRSAATKRWREWYATIDPH